MRRGFLYWAHLDKRRPALIVSSDDFNSRSSYVTLVPATSHMRPLITHVHLSPGDGGVQRPTMLKCESLHEVRRSDVEPEPLGPPLTPARMREVEGAIRFYLDLEP